jgi:phosphohistidine phosphatase
MTIAPEQSLRVFLVRHAHAGWAQPGMRDFDRPLDQRGREEVERLATTMSVNGFVPDLVYCSGARRCTETLDILVARMGMNPRIEHSDTLYSDSHRAYLDLIASDQAGKAGSIMIVGHNPMLEDTAMALLQHDPSALEEALGTGFPTAGLFVADCTRGQDSIGPGQTSFIALLSPVDA